MNGLDWLQLTAYFGALLAFTPCSAAGWRGQGSCHAGAINHLKTKPMTDLTYIAVLALFFVAGEFYAHWCEKL